MLRELIKIFSGSDPLGRMGEDFQTMMVRAKELTLQAGTAYFDNPLTADERTEVYKKDVKINKLERKIRKQVIAHLSVGTNGGDTVYCLLLMSLLKDVERIGDYAKNLAETRDVGAGLPDDANRDELQEIRAGVEEMFERVGHVFAESETEEAVELIADGQELSKRCDALILRIAKSDYDAATTTTLVLGTRYYKRIAAHMVNVLTGVVMPLHKLDYYDEKELA